MIDRAGSLTETEAAALGTLWKSSEGLTLSGSIGSDHGRVAVAVATNFALVHAWERALEAAGGAGRADEIDAAREAGRAASHGVRHLKIDATSKDGAEEAARAAVLAVGVRDLITDADYAILASAWQQALGDL
jgi:hypothetical protein